MERQDGQSLTFSFHAGNEATGARVRLIDSGGPKRPRGGGGGSSISPRSLRSWVVPTVCGTLVVVTVTLLFMMLANQSETGGTNDAAASLRELLKPRPPQTNLLPAAPCGMTMRILRAVRFRPTPQLAIRRTRRIAHQHELKKEACSGR